MLGQGVELLLGGHVLNRIATAQEANPELGSFGKTVLFLKKKGGLGEFYKGLRWNLVQGCYKGATRWGLNNMLFHYWERMLPNSWIVPVAVALSSAFTEATVLCAFESLKTKEMTGARVTLDTVRNHRLMHGWKPLFYRQALVGTNYLLVYDKARAVLLAWKENKPVNTLEKMGLSAFTGFTACLLNTPFDMWRAQRQKYDPFKEYRLIPAFKELISAYGVSGVYRSLPTRAARSAFYAIATFTIMDKFDALPGRMKLS